MTALSQHQADLNLNFGAKLRHCVLCHQSSVRQTQNPRLLCNVNNGGANEEEVTPDTWNSKWFQRRRGGGGAGRGGVFHHTKKENGNDDDWKEKVIGIWLCKFTNVVCWGKVVECGVEQSLVLYGSLLKCQLFNLTSSTRSNRFTTWASNADHSFRLSADWAQLSSHSDCYHLTVQISRVLCFN